MVHYVQLPPAPILAGVRVGLGEEVLQDLLWVLIP
jgi:hypothetical protein